ncbi:acyl-CoA synthetase [Sporosarcina sp. CAU 1771]
MNYQKLQDSFSWEDVIDRFDWNVHEKFNFAHECCDRWAEDSHRVAIYWEDEVGKKQTWTYVELKNQSNRMANALRSMGVKKGDRVAGLLGKDMELIITVIATFKLGAIYVPLFTAFGPEAILHRLNDASCKVLITNKEQAKKLEGLKVSSTVILTDEESSDGTSFEEFVQSFPATFETEPTKFMDPCVLQYTSGSTGKPKGATWSHKLLISMDPYITQAMGIEEDDIFFGGADMGWAYGLINCTLAPLSYGVPIVVYKGSFKVEKVYQLLEDYKISNMAYAPTAYRMMAKSGPELIKQYSIQVKKFSSAGEPLNAEVVHFFKKNFGREVYDHYGSTETGMIVNNYNSTDMIVKSGSMGLPSPGFTVELLDVAGNPVDKGEIGEIATDSTAFSFYFLGYWMDSEKTKEKYKGKWFLTGDLASMDEDGYFWFEGRSDDIISSAGYRIGPFEVESCLLEHPAVAEVAVVGKPDQLKGEIVKAFVVLTPSSKPLESLEEELSVFVKNKLSKHQYPREIEFIDSLPKTQSGKIQRYILKQSMQTSKN